MADRTAIAWTDATWNPVTGCTKVSPGCDHCYAERFAERWRGVPGHAYEHGFDVTLRPERLDQPLRWTRPRRIFVNSMSDLFHEDIEDNYIDLVFRVMAEAHWHTFQVLTKRPGRMRAFMARHRFHTDDGRPPFLPNVWLGASVESNAQRGRVGTLLGTPAALRFLSLEPLLGPIDALLLDGIGWVIAGGESGPGARPMDPAWVRAIRDQCARAGVPFFFKQWGGARSGGPALLDGRAWHEFPAAAANAVESRP